MRTTKNIKYIYNHRSVIIIMLMTGFIKLYIFFMFGPIMSPDSYGYLLLSDMIRAGNINDIDWSLSIPPNLFRILGYPAFLTFARYMSGDSWATFTVSAQIILSTLAFTRLYILSIRCSLSTTVSSIICILPLLSQSLWLDQAILTDSLFSSFIIFATCSMAEYIITERQMSQFSALWVGICLAIGFLLRESTVYLLAALLPLILCSSFIISNRPYIKKCILLFSMLLPLISVHYVYREWNNARGGADIVTTGGQTTLFQALQMASQGDPLFWNNDDIISATASGILKSDNFSEVIKLNDVLHYQFKMSAVDITRAGFSQYFYYWKNKPIKMLINLPLRNARLSYAALWMAPIDSVRLMMLVGSNHRLPKLDKAWTSPGVPSWVYPLLGIEMLCKLASYVIFAGFFLLVPYRLLRGQGRRGEKLAQAAVWLLFMGFFSIYALVHIEARYLAPVIPLSSLIGALNLKWLSDRLLSPPGSHKIADYRRNVTKT